MEAATLHAIHLLPRLIAFTHTLGNNTIAHSPNLSLGGAGIAGIVLLAIAIIFWAILLCVCFHVRCLLNEDNDEEGKEKEEAEV